MQYLLISTGILSVIVFVVSSVMIYGQLKDRGEKVSFLWLRLYIISYANRYKKITKKETGKTGYLFYVWIISVNVALISAILALFVFLFLQ